MIIMLSKVTDNKRAISVLYTKHRHVSRLCQIFRRAYTHTPAEMDEYVYDHSVKFGTLLVEIPLVTPYGAHNFTKRRRFGVAMWLETAYANNEINSRGKIMKPSRDLQLSLG